MTIAPHHLRASACPRQLEHLMYREQAAVHEMFRGKLTSGISIEPGIELDLNHLPSLKYLQLDIR